MRRLSEIAANNSLTIYLTLGYPSSKTMLEVVEELIKLGVDMLEFGIPYEAPKYDGPTIRKTHKTTLSNGFNYEQALTLLKEITTNNQFLLTYYELAHKIGVEKFFREISDTRVKAILFPDLLIEYPNELNYYDKLCMEHGLEKVYFISSSFPHNMIRNLANRDPSFIYMGLMASTGVSLPIHVKRNIAIIRKLLGDIPMIGGFAIKTPEQIKEYINAGVNGIVIGSAVIKILNENPLSDFRFRLREFLIPMIKVLKNQ